MSRQQSVPTYRKHKATGQAIVTLPDGFGGRKDNYLGPYGSEESRREYARLNQEWETRGRRVPQDAGHGKNDLTINELILAYWNWVQARYVKDGKPTNEQATARPCDLCASFTATRSPVNSAP